MSFGPGAYWVSVGVGFGIGSNPPDMLQLQVRIKGHLYYELRHVKHEQVCKCIDDEGEPYMQWEYRAWSPSESVAEVKWLDHGYIKETNYNERLRLAPGESKDIPSLEEFVSRIPRCPF